MAKDNIYQHNFRLSMDNPIHYKLHQRLMNINKDIYKSKNEYMIKMLCNGIFGESDEEVLSLKDSIEDRLNVPEGVDGAQYVQEILNKMETKITENVMKEVLKTLMNMIVWNNPMQGISQGTTQKVYEEEPVDDDIADAALGYFEE